MKIDFIINNLIIINNHAIDIGRGVLHTPGLVMNNRGNKPDILHIPVSPNPDSVVKNQGAYNTSLQKTDGRDLGVCDTPLRSPSNTIGAIVRGYKSAVTKQINILGLGNYKQSATVWLRSFHDHIIRDEKSYQYISNYIVNNPAKWDEDTFHKI